MIVVLDVQVTGGARGELVEVAVVVPSTVVLVSVDGGEGVVIVIVAVISMEV